MAVHDSKSALVVINLCLGKCFFLNTKYDNRNLFFAYKVRYDVRELCPIALKERGAQHVAVVCAIACLSDKKCASIYSSGAHYRN